MKKITSYIHLGSSMKVLIFSFICLLGGLSEVQGAQLIQDCRSGGKGTLQECQQRDDKEAQKVTQTTSPQCWLLPGGGSTIANANSTPPVKGARLGKCPNFDTKSITANQAQPSNPNTIEKNIDCRSGGRDTAQECQQRDAQADAKTKALNAEKRIDCRSGGRGTAQECQQRDTQAQAHAQAQTNNRPAEKIFDCRSGGRGTAQECQQRDAQAQTQSNARAAEKIYDCRSGGRGTAQECQQRDAQTQAQSKERTTEKTFDCRSGGRGTAQECQQRDAQEQGQSNTRTTEKIFDCRSGGRGTAKECVERDNLATQRAPQTASQQCWLFPNGGNTLAHANSTPPVAGARLGACPFNKQIATQTAQTTPQLDSQTTVKTYDCRSGGTGTAQECQQRDRESQEQISNRNNEKTYTCNSGGRGTAKECIERDKLEGQIPIQSNSQKCWLLPDGGTIVAHPNSTPPVSGARLSACSNSSSNIALMPTQKVKASPSLSGQIVEKTNDCKNGSNGSSKECIERNEIANQKSTITTTTTCWVLPSGGYIEAHAISTPPVAGARLSSCPSSEKMTPRDNKSIKYPIESPQQILAPTKPFSAETTKTTQLDSRWHGKWDAFTVQVNGDISNSDKTNFIWISQRHKLPKRKGCWAFYDGSTTKSELEKSIRIAGTSIEEKKDIKDTIASLSNNQFSNVSLACTDISGAEEPMGDCIKSFFYDKDSIFQKSFCQLDSKISFHISRLKRLNTIQTTISNRPNTQSTFFHPLENGKNTKIVDGAGFFDPSYLKTEDRQHLGSDLRAKGGAKVFAMKNGTVAFYCGYNQNDPMQKAVVVQNDDKTTTVYGHINPLSNEVIKIKAGDLIGHVLEYSTSYPEFTPHLHLGETDNLKINCASRLKSNGKWGWGRAPKDSKKETATEEGWIDAAKKYGYVAISN